MQKTLFLALLAVIVTAISCKKSDPAAAPVKFMFLTTGSTWNYKSTNNPSTTPVVSNYTLTATSSDSTINGRVYKKLSSSNGNNEFYNITGSDYYQYAKLPDALGGGFAEVLYLKDNATVGTEWTQTFPVTIATLPINLTVKNKISQKGISKTVNGIAYADVIDVESTLTPSGIPAFITYTLTTNIHYYYAPKVGLIENQYNINLTINPSPLIPAVPPVVVDQKTELQSATIL